MSVPAAHRVRTADGTVIALHRVTDAGQGGIPVLLAPGTFSTRSFWLGSPGQGFGYALAGVGLDAWVMEPRGHGDSDRPDCWTMDDWVRLDAPAAVEGVLDLTGKRDLFWVGHSAGGVVGAAFAGSGHPAAARVRGFVLIGAPGPGTLRGIRRAGAWTLLAGARALPRVHWPGQPIGLGPEREPGRLVGDWMRWNVSGRWRGRSGEDYLDALHGCTTPVLAVAGDGDRLLAPPHSVRDLLSRFGSTDATLMVAGRGHGYSKDFDHSGLVIGSAAKTEIWPRVIAWIRERSGEPMPSAPQQKVSDNP